jgi:2-hydroxy-3-oxopropionate reductase
MVQKVNVVGLGVMGLPMAAHLSRAGLAVRGFARTEATRARARERGIDVVDALDALPVDADVIITMLPDGPDVEAVLFEPGGLVSRTAPGALFVDMSTISPDAARSIGERARERGHRFVDAPVSGGQAGAENASLSIMVGGEDADVQDARAVLEVVGSTIVHVGPLGAGQVTKAANQMIVAGNIAILAEALVFIERNGIDRARALEVLAGGLAGSTVLDRKSAAMLADDYTPGFRLALHAKDLGIVENSATARGLDLRVNELVTSIVREFVEEGNAGLDHAALYLAAKSRA